MDWKTFGYDAIIFIMVFVILVAVMLFVVPIFITIVPAPYNSILVNLTNDIGYAINLIGKPIILIPLIVVIVVVVFIAVREIQKSTDGVRGGGRS